MGLYEWNLTAILPLVLVLTRAKARQVPQTTLSPGGGFLLPNLINELNKIVIGAIDDSIYMQKTTKKSVIDANYSEPVKRPDEETEGLINPWAAQAPTKPVFPSSSVFVQATEVATTVFENEDDSENEDDDDKRTEVDDDDNYIEEDDDDKRTEEDDDDKRTEEDDEEYNKRIEDYLTKKVKVSISK